MILYYVTDKSLTPHGVEIFFAHEADARAAHAESGGVLCTLHVPGPLTYAITDPISV